MWKRRKYIKYREMMLRGLFAAEHLRARGANCVGRYKKKEHATKKKKRGKREKKSDKGWNKVPATVNHERAWEIRDFIKMSALSHLFIFFFFVASLFTADWSRSTINARGEFLTEFCTRCALFCTHQCRRGVFFFITHNAIHFPRSEKYFTSYWKFVCNSYILFLLHIFFQYIYV